MVSNYVIFCHKKRVKVECKYLVILVYKIKKSNSRHNCATEQFQSFLYIPFIELTVKREKCYNVLFTCFFEFKKSDPLTGPPAI